MSEDVVKAVLALHSPSSEDPNGIYGAFCQGCDQGDYAEPGRWPCRTVLLIEEIKAAA